MKIGNIDIEKPIILAPMEDVTDTSFRLICKKMGADIVYTELGFNVKNVVSRVMKLLAK